LAQKRAPSLSPLPGNAVYDFSVCHWHRPVLFTDFRQDQESRKKRCLMFAEKWFTALPAGANAGRTKTNPRRGMPRSGFDDFREAAKPLRTQNG
jgi:hypothetical protein